MSVGTESPYTAAGQGAEQQTGGQSSFNHFAQMCEPCAPAMMHTDACLTERPKSHSYACFGLCKHPGYSCVTAKPGKPGSQRL